MTTPEPLAAVLRRGRLEQHLSQREAAAKIGVTPNTISRWERGRLVPEGRHRDQAFAVYGIPLEAVGGSQDFEDLRARVAELEAVVGRLVAASER